MTHDFSIAVNSCAMTSCIGSKCTTLIVGAQISEQISTSGTPRVLKRVIGYKTADYEWSC